MVLELLLIENSLADARLVLEALRQSTTATHLSVARNGEEGLAFLRRQGAYRTAPQPDLVVLDLDLGAGIHGRQVLEEIKADTALRTIPVVVLTGSNEPQDIQRSYDLHANAYVTKPIQLDDFLAKVTSIVGFWHETATRPVRP
jgi:CheY-like chemotaxis protein